MDATSGTPASTTGELAQRDPPGVAESSSSGGSHLAPAGAPGLGAMLVKLGFVVVFVGAAIALIVTGYTAIAAVEAVFGAALAAVEIIRRLG